MASAAVSISGRKSKWAIWVAIAVVIVVAMALDTTAVRIGSERDQSEQGFSPQQYGQEQFPRIRDYVKENAVDAVELSKAIADDQSAAAEKYGVSAGVGSIIPVRFTGEVGKGSSGVFAVDVDGLPDDLTVRVQTGPAINGTALRDAPGDIEFGEFTNQIEYQNAGAGINNAMKKEVLSDLDRDSLSGKTMRVVGVFQLINPNNWLVIPVVLEVQ